MLGRLAFQALPSAIKISHAQLSLHARDLLVSATGDRYGTRHFQKMARKCQLEA